MRVAQMTVGKGFTLAEVLVAMALLGVVAAFSIPKVMQVIQNNHYNSMAKEALSMASNAVIDLKRQSTGPLDVTSTTFDSMLNAINKPAPVDCPPMDVRLSGLDVNNDGSVTPADSGAVINYLNLNGAGPASGAPQYDVNGDGWITAMDSLMIINYLNAGSPPILPEACYTFANGGTLSVSQVFKDAPIHFGFKPATTLANTNSDIFYFTVRANGKSESLGSQKNNPSLDPPWLKW